MIAPVRRAAGIAALSLVLSALGAQAASATFHEVMIREVYPGTQAHPKSEYVELQMWSAGQNLVDGHTLSFYNASGGPVGSATFGHDVGGGANQSTLVAATPEAEAEFGSADGGMPSSGVPASGLLDPVGGAVCWESLDCVAWGNFSGLVKSPVGQPAVPGGIPDGMALRRTIEPGCATLLEPGDDRDDSAADFSAVFPSPRPNSTPPSERPCSAQAGGGGNPSPGGGSDGGGEKRPQTKIRQSPPRRTRDRTPTFRFGSTVPGSTFLCKLDRRSFKRCRSPFTAPRLAFGAHVFKVKASTPGGAADPSPASYGFTVSRPRLSSGR